MSDKDPRAPKFPVIVKHPTFGDVKSNFSGNDYLQWGGVTAASFPLGYIFGTQSFIHINSLFVPIIDALLLMSALY